MTNYFSPIILFDASDADNLHSRVWFLLPELGLQRHDLRIGGFDLR